MKKRIPPATLIAAILAIKFAYLAPVVHKFIAIKRKAKGNDRTVAMLSAYIQLIYSLDAIYMIYRVILHHCRTVK